MKTRKEIRDRIKANIEQVRILEAENIELHREDYLLNDETQWFTEEMQTLGRGKKKYEALIGRVNWVDTIKDESTGQSIDIQRSCAVQVNGEWR